MNADVKVILIAAVAENSIIGKNGNLPWNIPEELQHFKKTTGTSPLVMGRKTYDSMPNFVWKTRTPYVLTRNAPRLTSHKAFFNEDLNWLLAAAKTNTETGEVYLIGGVSVFERFDLADELLITHVNGDWEGDTYMPDFLEAFRRVATELRHPEFTVVRYAKRNQ